ncbi:hypothetical protein BHL35_18625 [Bacillus cereus]|nr:hypothetical protein BHL35_18625 [Bacillus cereus]
MNNYYGYNQSSNTNNYNYQPTPNTIYNQEYTRPVSRRIDLTTNMPGTDIKDLKDGFVRYTWLNVVNIQPGETIDFRLTASPNEQVISGGFSTNPVENVYAVTSAPHSSYPFVMAVMLHNASGISVLPDLWVVVKRQ